MWKLAIRLDEGEFVDTELENEETARAELERVSQEVRGAPDKAMVVVGSIAVRAALVRSLKVYESSG